LPTRIAACTGDRISASAGADQGSRYRGDLSAASHLPIAADSFRLTWVTGRTTVLTEPHRDELLRANLWHLRGREPDLLDSSSLLAAYGHMVMLDLAGGTPVHICRRCKMPFVHTDRRAGYCSDRCRWAAQKAASWKRKAIAETRRP